ncbi:hypothetical protein Tco_1044944 [Tanacetum coccineum]|uniref:Retrotransposon gag domain-containing protein n=1 Tax=Tanacetum coccineum TaxID=301880 RepID=A0ABQ5GRX7_9ASTR
MPTSRPMSDQCLLLLAMAHVLQTGRADDRYFENGTKGVVELTQWFERMETVFHISNCSMENQIKFSTCTLLAGALTWWNSHVRIVGHDVAAYYYDLDRSENKHGMTRYKPRFQELALLCVRMLPEESDKVERYVGGLPDMIHGNVVASKPKNHAGSY